MAVPAAPKLHEARGSETLPDDRLSPAVPLRPADAALLERLTAALGPEAVRPPEPRYLEEPRGRYHGRAAAVLRPGTTAAVATAVRLCAEARVGIVPYAGGTGLVGGQLLEEGPLPVVLSVERLNRVRDLDLTDNLLIAEAGCILADVQAAARDAGRLFPLSLASEGSARIGGLLGTNAGGVAVLRYGNARDLCLGVEAVMADGSVLAGVGRLVKDNMGYDLRHLLIGSEGTLAIITAASLRLFPRPGEIATAWIGVPSPAVALELLRAMRDALGGTLSAFELIDVTGLDFLAATMPQVPLPPAMGTGWRVLVEAPTASGSRNASRRFSPRRSTRDSPPTRWSPRAAPSATPSGRSANRSPRPTASSARSTARTSRCRPHASPPSSTRPAPRWRRSTRRSASTASATSATATSTTTSIRRRARAAPPTRGCGRRSRRRCTI